MQLLSKKKKKAQKPKLIYEMFLDLDIQLDKLRPEQTIILKKFCKRLNKLLGLQMYI